MDVNKKLSLQKNLRDDANCMFFFVVRGKDRWRFPPPGGWDWGWQYGWYRFETYDR